MMYRTLARSAAAVALSAVAIAGTVAQSGRNNPNQKDWLQLFNGKDLNDWVIKFARHDLGENVNDTFRVEDGLLKVRYDKWTSFDREFGHIFYKQPFSYYLLAAEYRFVGEQVAAAGPSLAWAKRNNGLMLHAPDPKTMLKDQDFPISIEVQLLGGLSDGRPRSTANLCTPGTHVVMNGQLHTPHCTNSSSKTYDGDQWVRVEVLVHGDELIRHMIDGQTVLEYTKPQIGGGAAAPTDPKVKVDGTPLTGGYISLQAETAATDFRKVELLNLEGCTDPKARNYKSYFVKSAPSACQYDKPAAPFVKRVVTTGLDNPFQMTWGPDNHLWVTERTAGRVTRVRPADGFRAPALVIRDLLTDGPGGLLGMAFDPGLLKGTGNDHVYVAHTYDADAGPSAVERRTKIVRFTYDSRAHALGSATDILTGLPAGTDHQGGRLAFGPDRKLYLTIGDLGANQLANFCNPDRSQSVPTAAQLQARDWSRYEGKVLRLNLDGSIPPDNPTIGGVRSHVYSYGHRNPQGLVFAPDGKLYESEHGPNTDDEVNLIRAGKNYGWPHVAGYRDDQSYAFANWSASQGVPCRSLTFTAYPQVPASVPLQKESSWSHPDFTPPLQTFHTVPTGYNFKNPKCAERELYYQCWPTVAPASLAMYAATNGIPGWDHSLLMPSLKHGTVYRIQLNADGTAVVGEPDENELFRTVNRYRDVAVSPDGLALFIATDVGGNTQDESGRPAAKVENPGAILEFRYLADRSR